MTLVGFCDCEARGHGHDGWLRRSRRCGRRAAYRSLIQSETGGATVVWCPDCADLYEAEVLRSVNR